MATSTTILAQLLRQRGQPIAAAELYAKAKDLLVKNWRALGNMALLEEDLGRFDEAMALLRRALALKPDYSLAHANLLFCVNYHPEKAAEEILAEYRRFDAAHARPHLPAKLAFANDPTPGRKLRVGYLSPDFREHAARHFIEPLLAHYDRAKIELFCYAEVANPDRVTREFQGQADHWRSTVGMTDDEVAAQIRRDQIDVLMDFGGHTSSSRLLVMAQEAGPRPDRLHAGPRLYVGALGGRCLPGRRCARASGCRAPVHGARHPSAAHSARLRAAPGHGRGWPLPAMRKGHVTFGYFGRPERINDRVVKAWSAILTKVPLSRLMLNSKAFSEAAFADLMAERFQAYGIGRERLEMVYTSPQPKTWAAYGDVDIALDPFPHNAGTTTIEAVWLGVPVVSIADRPSVGRFGASILGCVGLSDWVAPQRRGVCGPRRRQGARSGRAGQASRQPPRPASRTLRCATAAASPATWSKPSAPSGPIGAKPPGKVRPPRLHSRPPSPPIRPATTSALGASPRPAWQLSPTTSRRATSAVFPPTGSGASPTR